MLQTDKNENVICVILSIPGALRPLHEERNKLAAVSDFLKLKAGYVIRRRLQAVNPPDDKSGWSQNIKR